VIAIPRERLSALADHLRAAGVSVEDRCEEGVARFATCEGGGGKVQLVVSAVPAHSIDPVAAEWVSVSVATNPSRSCALRGPDRDLASFVADLLVAFRDGGARVPSGRLDG
jgi:hypothetical protein